MSAAKKPAHTPGEMLVDPIVEALREERKRLVRIAVAFGANTALAAVGFTRCRETHVESGQRCQLGRGHGGKVPPYAQHQSESVTWLTERGAGHGD